MRRCRSTSSARSSTSLSITRCRHSAAFSRPAMNTSASEAQPLLRMRAVEKSFGVHKVLQGIDLDVHRGEVVTIIGPSGSGKTTLLRCVNVLETYDAGSIGIDGVEVGYRDEGGARRPRRERDLARMR